MKIALINPEASVNRFDFKRFLGEPLGLLYVASMLEHHGHEVKVFDLQMTTNLNLPEEIDYYGLDIVGITSMTANFYKAEKVAKLIRQNSSAFVVLGGVHATFTHNELSHHPEFDAYVIGEGEFTMLELVNTLESKDELSKVKGLVYRANGNIFYNKPRPRIDNLDAIPLPARHLVDIPAYIKHKESLSLITTRGCPYSCIFCSNRRLHGTKYRQRNIENVMKEIKVMCERYDPPRLNFVDSNFTFNPQHVKKFCHQYVEHGFNPTWSCCARVDNVDKALLELMRDSGCGNIFFGIESGSQRILDMIRKDFKLEQAEKVVKLAKDVGIKVTTSFIIGLPGEKETIKETIEFAKKLDADTCLFFLITPYPGTYLTENLEKFGYKIADRDLSHYTGDYPILETKELRIHDLQSALIKAALELSKKVN